MPSARVVPAPYLDPELERLLAESKVPPSMPLASMVLNRTRPETPPVEESVAARDLVREDRSIDGPDGAPPLTVSIFCRSGHAAAGLGLLYLHGGGMVGGNRFTGIDRMLEWVELFDAVAVTVEYRLAPENPDPAPVTDCFAALGWMAAHSSELGFDPARLVIVGPSAGGGLAAGAALMARDRGGPPLAAQMLFAPMLDDRNQSLSSRQVDGVGVWDRTSNETGWTALLGGRRGTDDVSIYAAPARASDLAGLPPAYIDCGSAEVFRDENIAFANAIWAAGGAAELHIWSGACHGFTSFFPNAGVSEAARQARTDFVRKTFNFTR